MNQKFRVKLSKKYRTCTAAGPKTQSPIRRGALKYTSGRRSGWSSPSHPNPETTPRVVNDGGLRASRGGASHSKDYARSVTYSSKLRHREFPRAFDSAPVRTEQRPSDRRAVVLDRYRVGVLHAHRMTWTSSIVVFVVVSAERPVRVRTNPSRLARTCGAWRPVPPTASAPAPSPPLRRARPGTRRFSARGVREGYGSLGLGHGAGSRRGRARRRRGRRWRTLFSSSRSNARFLRRTFCVREGARMSVTSALASRTSFLPCEMEMRSGWAGNRASVIGKVRWRGRVPSGSGARAEDAPGGGR